MRGAAFVHHCIRPDVMETRVAAAVLFLASREAGYIAGEALGVFGCMGIGGA